MFELWFNFKRSFIVGTDLLIWPYLHQVLTWCTCNEKYNNNARRIMPCEFSRLFHLTSLITRRRVRSRKKEKNKVTFGPSAAERVFSKSRSRDVTERSLTFVVGRPTKLVAALEAKNLALRSSKYLWNFQCHLETTLKNWRQKKSKLMTTCFDAWFAFLSCLLFKMETFKSTRQTR